MYDLSTSTCTMYMYMYMYKPLQRSEGGPFAAQHRRALVRVEQSVQHTQRDGVRTVVTAAVFLLRARTP